MVKFAKFRNMVAQIRRDILRMVQGAASLHPGECKFSHIT